MREPRSIELGEMAIGPTDVTQLARRLEDPDGFTVTLRTRDGNIYEDVGIKRLTASELVCCDAVDLDYALPLDQIVELTINEF